MQNRIKISVSDENGNALTKIGFSVKGTCKEPSNSELVSILYEAIDMLKEPNVDMEVENLKVEGWKFRERVISHYANDIKITEFKSPRMNFWRSYAREQVDFKEEEKDAICVEYYNKIRSSFETKLAKEINEFVKKHDRAPTDFTITLS